MQNELLLCSKQIIYASVSLRHCVSYEVARQLCDYQSCQLLTCKCSPDDDLYWSRHGGDL